MDLSLCGVAFPSNIFSSEFQFDCAFGFDGEFNFGFGGDFNFLSVHKSGFGGASFGADPFDYDGVSIDCSIEGYVSFRRRRCRRIRQTNRHFWIESVKKSCWYVQFLKPGITRQMTHELSSSDRYGNFCHYFRIPLFKVEELTSLVIRRGYIDQPRLYFRQQEYRERAEISVMSALFTLGNGALFRSLQAQTNISISECRKFFLRFIDAMVDMKDDFIYLPRNVGEMNRLERDYREVGLPGACGSVDVVHIKWGCCPTGDINRAKGKEGYPTFAYQCITNFNRQIIGIYGPTFGSHNDKDIVKTDPNVKKVGQGFMSRCYWQYYDEDGTVRTSKGMFLFYDNGYLTWLTTICPHAHFDSTTMEVFFSTNLESVRKDVECTFGILKKCWRVFNNEILFCDIDVCDKVFTTCCCLHNFLLNLMEKHNVWVGRGGPLENDGIWLSGNTATDHDVETNTILANKFVRRRAILAMHLRVLRDIGPIVYEVDGEGE